MTRENGFYWVQREEGVWTVGKWFRRSWAFADDDSPLAVFDNELHAINAERIKEPDYQP